MRQTSFAQNGYVYLLKYPEQGIYKIGATINPHTRFRKSQEIVFCYPCIDYRDKEKEIIKKFKGKTKKGREWFELKPKDIEEIQNIVSRPTPKGYIPFDGIENLRFDEKKDQQVIDIANRLAKFENRPPHDSLRLLIIEAGLAKIQELEQKK